MNFSGLPDQRFAMLSSIAGRRFASSNPRNGEERLSSRALNLWLHDRHPISSDLHSRVRLLALRAVSLDSGNEAQTVSRPAIGREAGKAGREEATIACQLPEGRRTK
jgi:hypothetical protein